MAIYPLKKENETITSIILRMLDMKIVDNYEIKRAMLQQYRFGQDTKHQGLKELLMASLKLTAAMLGIQHH